MDFAHSQENVYIKHFSIYREKVQSTLRLCGGKSVFALEMLHSALIKGFLSWAVGSTIEISYSSEP